MADAAKWYVVHTFSSYENKVAETIMTVAHNRGLEDQILDVRYPTEKIVEKVEKTDKDGNTVTVEKVTESKILPGYVLVKMVLTDDSWYVVRNTRGVTGFVGPGGEAFPLSDKEVERFGVAEPEVKAKVDVKFKLGDEVRINSGMMEGMTGKVTDINAEEGTVVVTVMMFGRETPATLELGQVSAV